MATSSTSSQISIPDQVGDFKLVTKPELDFAKGTQLAKWESQSTGLKVVWSGVEGKSELPSSLLDVWNAAGIALEANSMCGQGYVEASSP